MSDLSDETDRNERLAAMARQDATNELIDAIAVPSGRDFARAWDQACFLHGRSDYKPTLFDALNQDLRRRAECHCGSGAHPRRCERHPNRYEAHVNEINIESLRATVEDLEKEVESLKPSDSDRIALATAVRELTERRNNYRARLAHLTERTDPHVREVYERAVAEVEAAIAAVERMAKR